jgi:hypothetical protein
MEQKAPLTEEKLFQLLTYIESVKISDWDWIRLLVDGINNKTIKVKVKRWADNFKDKNPDFYPLDLSRIDTWSTYTGCYDITFYNKTVYNKPKNKLECKVVVYDGDPVYGYRNGKKFDAVLTLPNEYIHKLAHLIDYKLTWVVDEEYTKHLDNLKHDWLVKRKQEITYQ